MVLDALGLSAITDFAGKLLDRLLPDKTAADAAKLEMFKAVQSGELAQLAASTDLAKAGASVIAAEASSGNWLAAAWRPIMMLSFVAIVVNNYILYPYINLFFHSGLVLQIPVDMWDLLKIGVGGYVIGRSGEKIAASIVSGKTNAV